MHFLYLNGWKQRTDFAFKTVQHRNFLFSHVEKINRYVFYVAVLVSILPVVSFFKSWCLLYKQTPKLCTRSF